MNKISEQRIISRFPVDEIWAGERLASTIQIRDLKSSDVIDLLRSGVVRFVVADIGKPFE